MTTTSDRQLPENAKDRLDEKLDHAITETFPTSDPVSVSITKGGAIDYDEDEFAGWSDEDDHPGVRDRVTQATGAARAGLARGRRYVQDHVGQQPSSETILAVALGFAVGFAAAWALRGRRGEDPDTELPDYARRR